MSQIQFKMTFDEVMDLYGTLPVTDWFRLLGKQWTVFNTHGQNLLRLKKIFARHPVERLSMMNSKDRETYNSLPNQIKVFRGCYKSSRLDMSWSLSRDVSCRFPFMGKHIEVDDGPPLLLSANIEISCSVFIGGNGEQEVIWVPQMGDFSELSLANCEYAKMLAASAA